MEIELDMQDEKGCPALEELATVLAYLHSTNALDKASWVITDYLIPALERKYPDKAARDYIQGKKRLAEFSSALYTLGQQGLMPPSPQWKLKI